MSVNNYIAAANASKQAFVAINDANNAARPDYASLGNEAVNQAALNAVNAAENNATVANAKINAERSVRNTQIKEDRDEAIRGYKRQAQMTGKLAGGAALLGIGAINLGKVDDEKPDARLSVLQNQLTMYQDRIKKSGSEITDLQSQLDNFEIPDMPSKSGSTKKGGTTSTPETMGVTTGSQPNTGAEQSGALSSLTDKDFDDLAFAVSSEAALGTDDEFGVAANIVTRLRSGKYGSSISEIINAPGQYEGVYKGMSKASPEIAARFKTPEGRQKIEQFIKVLDGRTEFKGQTMLKNRVEAEDPMFDPKGNFYHFAGQ